MKCFFLLLLFACAAPSFAQTAKTIPAAAPGCGTVDTKFEVATDKSKHLVAKPDPGTALIYFLQDDARFEYRPRPTTRFALDGSWIGATQSNSYFSISVNPGTYLVCAEWQSFEGFYILRKAAGSHVTAVAGGVYFFVVRDIYPLDQGPASMTFWPIEIDEARDLMSRYALSKSQPKK
jgi:hypothetical protein